MTPTQAAIILKNHNEWRTWDCECNHTPEPQPAHPKDLTAAIDVAVAFIESSTSEAL